MSLREYINSRRSCANCSKSRILGLGITCKYYDAACYCSRHKMKIEVYQNYVFIYKHLKP